MGGTFRGEVPMPLDSGHTTWVLVSSALVLFMMIPGLALFYAGLVRTKNVLSVLMQCIALTAVLIYLAIMRIIHRNYTIEADTMIFIGRRGGALESSWLVP